MSGSGTENSPYIVNTWNELIETAQNADSDTYITLSGLEYVDLSSSVFSDSLVLNGVIDFQGCIIKRFYSTANTAISANGTLKNFTMEDYFHSPSSENENSFFINGDFLVQNGNISGESNSNSTTNLYGFFNGTMIQSGIAIKVNSGNGFYFRYGVGSETANKTINGFSMVDCDVNLDVIADECNLFVGVYGAINGFFNGDINVKNNDCNIGRNYSLNNIYNISCNCPLLYTGYGMSVYNSDIADSSTDSNTMLIPCTEENLQLGLIRYNFPIDIIQG